METLSFSEYAQTLSNSNLMLIQNNNRQNIANATSASNHGPLKSSNSFLQSQKSEVEIIPRTVDTTFAQPKSAMKSNAKPAHNSKSVTGNKKATSKGKQQSKENQAVSLQKEK